MPKCKYHHCPTAAAPARHACLTHLAQQRAFSRAHRTRRLQRGLCDFGTCPEPAVPGSRRCAAHGTIACQLCGARLLLIVTHLRRRHPEVSSAAYRARFPGAPLIDPAVHQRAQKKAAATKYERIRWLECRLCHVRFQRRKHLSHPPKYCSTTCRVSAARLRMKKGRVVACGTCGKEFYRPPCYGQRYCSLRCRPPVPQDAPGLVAHRAQRRADRIARRTKECAQCGRSFYATGRANATTCSVRCRNRFFAFFRGPRTARRQPCARCGKPFQAIPSTRRRFCSQACNYRAKRGSFPAAAREAGLAHNRAVHEAQTAQRQRTCATCAAAFTVSRPSARTRYCSRRCSARDPAQLERAKAALALGRAVRRAKALTAKESPV